MSSVFSFVHGQLESYRWLMARLPRELRDVVRSYRDAADAGWFGQRGALESRLSGLGPLQRPSVFGTPSLLETRAWRDVPPVVGDTLTAELLDAIGAEYLSLSLANDSAVGVKGGDGGTDSASGIVHLPSYMEEISLPGPQGDAKSISDSATVSAAASVSTPAASAAPSTSAAVAGQRKWQVYYLLEEGVWNAESVSRCPRLYAWLRTLRLCDCAFGYAYFSALPARSRIHAHCGASNAKVRVQIPLPVSGCDWSKCELTVGGESRRYSGDRAMAFDDSYLHSVRNDGDVDRVVLLVDLWNPELQEVTVSKIRQMCQSNTLFQGTENHFELPPPPTRDPERNYDYVMKTLCIGDSGVGKSRLVLRMGDLDMDEPWQDGYISTIGVDFKIATYQIRNLTIKFQCWDVAGPERFRTITSSYYRGAHIIYLVMDTTDRSPLSEVLDRLDHWYRETRKHASPDTVLVVVGTKTDLADQRTIPCEAGQQFAADRHLPYFEVSSKTGQGVAQMMRFAASRRLRHAMPAPAVKKQAGGRGNEAPTKKPSKCIIC